MYFIKKIVIPLMFITVDDIIFCSIILAFFFLIYIISLLYKENKKLQKIINKLEKELEKNKSKEMTVKERKSVPSKIDNNIKSETKTTNNFEKEIKIEKEYSSKPYQKNVLKNIKAPVSPISINKEGPTIKELKMNLNDFIKKERKNGNNVKILTSKDYENRSSSNAYMEEVSKRLAEANDNSPIELTDYEKKQEREAIISYKELIKNKDKINIVDDEADIEFINELKKFRDTLNRN